MSGMVLLNQMYLTSTNFGNAVLFFGAVASTIDIYLSLLKSISMWGTDINKGLKNTNIYMR